MRDHCHFSGNFRGAAHSRFTISFSASIKLNSFVKKDNEMVQLPHKLRFIDSFKFMPASLDKLVANLTKDDFNHI